MGKTGRGVGNESTLWCLDQASREYIIVVRKKQQVLFFFRLSISKQMQKACPLCKKHDGKKPLSRYMQNLFKANFTPSCVTLSPSLIIAEWIHIKLYAFKIITLAFETESQVFCWGKLKQIHWLNAVNPAFWFSFSNKKIHMENAEKLSGWNFLPASLAIGFRRARISCRFSCPLIPSLKQVKKNV